MPTTRISKDTIVDLVTITGQADSRIFTLKVPAGKLAETFEPAVRQIQRSSLPLKTRPTS
jgi:hypothetical protein